MKKILPLIVFTILFASCNKVEDSENISDRFEPLERNEYVGWTITGKTLELYAYNSKEKNQRVLLEFAFAEEMKDGNEIRLGETTLSEDKRIVIVNPIFAEINVKKGTVKQLAEGFGNAVVHDYGKITYQNPEEPYNYKVYDIETQTIVDEFNFKVASEKDGGDYYLRSSENSCYIDYRLRSGVNLAYAIYDINAGEFSFSNDYTEENVYLYDVTERAMYQDGEIYKYFEPLAEDEVFVWKTKEDNDDIEIYAQSITNPKQVRFITNFTVKDTNFWGYPALRMNRERNKIIMATPIFGIIDGEEGYIKKIASYVNSFALSYNGEYVLYRRDNTVSLEESPIYYVYSLKEMQVIDEFSWTATLPFIESMPDLSEYRPNEYKIISNNNSFYILFNDEHDSINALAEYNFDTREFTVQYDYNEKYDMDYDEPLHLWSADKTLNLTIDSYLYD